MFRVSLGWQKSWAGRNHEDDLLRFSGSLGPVPGMALQHPAAVEENAGENDGLARLVKTLFFPSRFGWP